MRRYTAIALVMIFITAMVTYSVLIWDNPENGGQKAEPGKPEDSLGGLTQAPVNPQNLRASKPASGQIELFFRRYYSYCGHTVAEEMDKNSSILTLNRDELLKLYPDWKIVEDRKNRLVLFHRVEDLCPQDMAKRYVGENGGYVAIFFGQPGMKEKLYRLTQVPVKGFPAQIKAQLARGIPSESEDHLISIIEGLEVYYEE